MPIEPFWIGFWGSLRSHKRRELEDVTVYSTPTPPAEAESAAAARGSAAATTAAAAAVAAAICIQMG